METTETLVVNLVRALEIAQRYLDEHGSPSRAKALTAAEIEEALHAARQADAVLGIKPSPTCDCPAPHCCVESHYFCEGCECDRAHNPATGAEPRYCADHPGEDDAPAYVADAQRFPCGSAVQ